MKRAIYSIVFPLAAFVLLIIWDDYLYAVAENDIFISGRTFLEERLSTEGGFWSWMGSFFTQFFHYPVLGAAMLVGLWTATYYLIADAFRLKGYRRLLAWIPVFAMLVSVLELGYWLFYIKMPGYWFSQSLSLFAAVLITWILSRLSALVTKKNLAWLFFLTAYFAVGQRFPVFQYRNYANHFMQIPFVVAPLSIVLLPLAQYVKVKIGRQWMKHTAAGIYLAVLCLTVYMASCRCSNYHSELRMIHALDECRWDDVLKEAKEAKRPTNLMVMYKNIALMHTNQLTDMFRVNNCGHLPQVNDSLRVFTAQLGSSMIYYQFGQINFSHRWAIENMVEYGLRVWNLKMLIRCAIMNREFDAAAKYLTLMNSTTVFKSWARERSPMLTSQDRLTSSAEFKAIEPLLGDEGDHLDIDDSMSEKWILNHYSDLIMQHPSSKLENLIICTSLWTNDEYAFCIHFYNYVNNHKGQAVPELYQQAAIMLCNAESSPVTLNNFPFDEMIQSRYNNFCTEYQQLMQQGFDAKQIGQKMRKAYGDTYWWYYYFYTDFTIY